MGWTQQDLDIYSQQLKNIEFECLGKFYLGGVFHCTEPDKPTELTFYLYRIYDRNFYPEALGVSKHGPLTESYAFGTMGLVAVPAKDAKTGSFHNLQKDPSTYAVPHPAAVWMDLRYKGQSYVIGRQVMYEFLGNLYNEYTTLDDNCNHVCAFSYADMDEKILPVLRQRFSLEIMAADNRHSLQFAD